MLQVIIVSSSLAGWCIESTNDLTEGKTLVKHLFEEVRKKDSEECKSGIDRPCKKCKLKYKYVHPFDIGDW